MKQKMLLFFVLFMITACSSDFPKVNDYEFRATPVTMSTGTGSLTAGFQVLWRFHSNGKVTAKSRIYFGKKITEDILYGTYQHNGTTIVVMLDKQDKGNTKLLSWSPITFTYDPVSKLVSNPIIHNGQTLEQACSPK